MSISGRCRDEEGKKHIAKQLANIPESIPSFDLKTGQLKTKKMPKEKSPQELAMRDLKSFQKKQHEST